MLSSLEISNFKGIKSGTISNLAQVNVLVGRNNSGKSTILDALVLMRCAFARTDYLDNDGLEQILKRKVDRGSLNYRELHHMLNTQEPIDLRATFADGAIVVEWDPLRERVVSLTSETTGGDRTTTENFGIGRGQSIEHVLNDERWRQIAREPLNNSAQAWMGRVVPFFGDVQASL